MEARIKCTSHIILYYAVVESMELHNTIIIIMVLVHRVYIHFDYLVGGPLFMIIDSCLQTFMLY